MKKILLCALVSTVFSANILANVPSTAFSGAYLGAGLNYTQEKYDLNADITGPGAAVLAAFLRTSTSGKASPKLNGGGVKFFGGYGAFLTHGLYLGGELGLGFDRILWRNKNKDLKSNKKLNYSIAARIGYAIENVMPYLKFGYEGRPSLNVGLPGIEMNIKRSGFILGGGVDVAITKNVFVRAEYIHGFGATSKKSVALGQSVGLPANSAVLNRRAKVKSDTFMLGAAYKF